MRSRILISRRGLGLALLSLAFLAPSSLAQDDAADVRSLVRSFRNQRASWDERDAAARELLGAGPEGAMQLEKAASSEFALRHKSWVKEEAGYLRSFESAATKAGVARSRAASAEDVVAQREELLKYSRSSGLSKAQVKSKCDPALAQLGRLLEVSVDDVLEPGSKIKEQRGDLLDEAMDLEWLAGLSGLARSFMPAEDSEGLVAVDFDSSVYRRLREIEGFMTLSGVATSASDKGALAFNQALAEQLSPEEFKGLYELNRIRILAGIGALKIDVKLCNAGRGHSKDMVEHGFFDHTSPLPGKTSPGDRSRLAGTSGGAENIAAGQESGEGAIRAWWYSPGHHRNMMGGHARVGLGRHQDHWTQMFG